jgi:hypothetical protein
MSVECKLFGGSASPGTKPTPDEDFPYRVDCTRAWWVNIDTQILLDWLLLIGYGNWSCKNTNYSITFKKEEDATAFTLRFL